MYDDSIQWNSCSTYVLLNCWLLSLRSILVGKRWQCWSPTREWSSECSRQAYGCSTECRPTRSSSMPRSTTSSWTTSYLAPFSQRCSPQSHHLSQWQQRVVREPYTNNLIEQHTTILNNMTHSLDPHDMILGLKFLIHISILFHIFLFILIICWLKLVRNIQNW